MDNGYDGQSAFDACQDAADHYGHAMDTFSDNVAGFIDWNPDVSVGDVVDSGMDAYASHGQMEAICGYDGDSGE